MFQKVKDVVMTIGNSIVQKSKALYEGFINKVRDTSRKVINKTMRIVASIVLSIALALGISTPVLADVPAGVTTAITTAATDVATVGAAVILVFVGIKVWKWIKAAL